MGRNRPKVPISLPPGRCLHSLGAFELSGFPGAAKTSTELTLNLITPERRKEHARDVCPHLES